MSKQALARGADDILANIFGFGKELAASPALQERLGHAHAWYAAKSGEWAFAPSKFAGYQSNSARKYLANAGRNGPSDGRETEHHLRRWFEEVEPDSKFGKELFAALESLLARWGKRPRAGARISVLKSELDSQPAVSRKTAEADRLMRRISVDSRICAGRPCIAGTRVRVSDILAMLAENASEKEILDDFPYLTQPDIAAALAYGARAVGHRVIRAA